MRYLGYYIINYKTKKENKYPQIDEKKNLGC